jgi:putative hydrolase of the HAD superfamily
MSKIRAITFDVGGTLIKPWPSVGQIYARVAARHGFPGIPPERLNEQFAEAWRGKVDFRHSWDDWRIVVKHTFTGFMDTLAEDFFHDLYLAFAEPGAWHVFDDVLPVLEELKNRGLRLAVVSNWDERLRVLLQRLELASWFDPIVVSIEVGHAKPAAEVFRKAVEGLRLPPEEILHVGDSPKEDVAGANDAGLEAVLLQRGKPERDGAIGTLRELARLLDN